MICIHLRGIEQKAEAQRIFEVAVVGGLADDAAHQIHHILLRGCHQRTASHDFLEHGLAAAALVPLKGPDAFIFTANLFPVPHFAGINVFNLVCAQGRYRVAFGDKKDKCFAPDRRELQLLACPLGLFLLGGRGGCGKDNVTVPGNQPFVSKGGGGAYNGVLIINFIWVVIVFRVHRLYKSGIERIKRGCSIQTRKLVIDMIGCGFIQYCCLGEGIERLVLRKVNLPVIDYSEAVDIGSVQLVSGCGQQAKPGKDGNAQVPGPGGEPLENGHDEISGQPAGDDDDKRCVEGQSKR
ncbi:hypothetical protein D3C73_505200 [compost metagenome]